MPVRVAVSGSGGIGRNVPRAINEWGFSNRLVDTAAAIGRTLEPRGEETRIAEEA